MSHTTIQRKTKQLKIIETRMDESKKSDMVQIYLRMEHKHWDLDVQTGSMFDDERKCYAKEIDLFLTACDDNNETLVVEHIEIISEYLTKFDYMDVDFKKNKEEIYLTFYEYPFEDEDLNILEIETKA